MKPRFLALSLVAASAVLATALALRSQATTAPSTSPSTRPALSVSVIQPDLQDLPLTLQASGSIAAWQEASIGTESNGWRLAEVRVQVGDVVRRGQVLARFTADLAGAELAQIRAAVAEAEATLAEAAANAQRARELQTSGALSAQQINQYLTAERTAQARLQAQKAAAEVQQLRLAQAQVLAPDDGVISARNATVGAVVPAGHELFRLIRQGRLEWRAEVPADDLVRVKPGQAVRVQAAGGAVLTGKVRMVAPTVDPATRNGLVYVDLPAGTGATASAAKAGMFARGDFVLGAGRGQTLPQAAVLLREGFHLVFVVGADGRVQQRKVTLGRRLGDRVEITAGLQPGERVVAAGGGFLADGDRVHVVAAAARPASAATPR
ncbi:MAG: efflux RND transporter periplasmic adaptor subunit [Rubrivivax sp.]|nr:efflux RND transporter periplasmic adaptor subunit [Rubrivivax sp.]